MGTFLRGAGGVVAGLLVGVIVIFLVESVSAWIFPPPPDLDPTDMEAMKRHMASLPLGAFLMVLLAWASGTLVGCFLAVRVGAGRRAAPGVVVGLLLLAAGVVNMLMLPHPVWFWAAAFLVCAISTLNGTRWGMRRA